ncbi:methyl-accepting chemotaxis protein [Pantoea sp. At-9b]
MNGIAFQTNILALNAAVEAASGTGSPPQKGDWLAFGHQ